MSDTIKWFLFPPTTSCYILPLDIVDGVIKNITYGDVCKSFSISFSVGYEWLWEIPDSDDSLSFIFYYMILSFWGVKIDWLY